MDPERYRRLNGLFNAAIEFGDNLYIVSEYVRGDTLRAESARGPLPPGTLIDTGVQMARALAAAHDQGVTHRDLKPENVIRTPERTDWILHA